MARVSSLLSAVLVFCLIISIQGQFQWDIFTFVQQWGSSVCVKAKQEGHTCVVPEGVKTWTIHGLWPDKRGTEQPNDCNASWPFNPSKIESLIPQMKIYWPNLFVDTKEDDFWSHEWDKHGTCATSLPATGNEFRYFNKSLQLRSQFDLYKDLFGSGFVPSTDKAYLAKDVWQVLKDHLKIPPKIVCYYDKSQKKYYLLEIEICLSKSFQMVDCTTPGTVKSQALNSTQKHSYFDGCPSDEGEGIYYPPLHNNTPQIFSV